MGVGEVFIRNITNVDFEALPGLIKELGYLPTESKVSDRLFKINSNKC